MNIPVKIRKKIKSVSETEKKSAERIAMISTHGYVAAEPPLGAPDTGGQVVYVLELSKVLSRLGYKVDIYTRLFESQPEYEEAGDGVRIIRIPCGGEDFIEKEYMAEVIDEWIINAFDYITENKKQYKFINSHYWDAGIAGMKLSKKLSVPHLHTPHSLGSWKKKEMEKDYPEDKDSFEKKYNFSSRIKNEKIIYDDAETVIATTPVQKKIIVSDYDLPVEKITMIPPGYDDNKFFPMAEATKTMFKDRFNFKDNCILALSRLAHNKGLDLLVESFGILVKDYCDAQLVLAIGHDERTELEDKIFKELIDIADKYNVREKIHFIGYIPDAEIADIYRAADLFVLSSRYEPFGMTAVEAMACGTPTIVTKHGGLCEVLQDGINAIITDPYFPEEMASDMAVIFRHEGIAQTLSVEGSKIARENFSWTEIAAGLLSKVGTKV